MTSAEVCACAALVSYARKMADDIALLQDIVTDSDYEPNFEIVLSDVSSMPTTERFGKPVESDLQEIIDNKDSTNTKKTTQVALAISRAFCTETGRCDEFESLSPAELNSLLREFYPNANARNNCIIRYEKTIIN